MSSYDRQLTIACVIVTLIGTFAAAGLDRIWTAHIAAVVELQK